MPHIQITDYYPEKKRGYTREYDTDKAKFICQTPEGRLLKKPRKCNFYLYNPKGKTKKEQIRELLYHEAKELIRQYGTKEQYCEYFSVYDAHGNFKTQKHTTITIDESHRIKLFRNASLYSMGMSEFVCYLIDKHDNMHVYNKDFKTKRRKGNRPIPEELTEFT